MSMSKFYLYILFLTIAILQSCKYQPILEREIIYETALIPVKINWTESGFEIDSSGEPTKQGRASVHRATFRFFPKDGSEPFERYLEGNVFEGEIEVPIGLYDVIVMNESYTDSYWDNTEDGGFYAIDFENVNSFQNFSAAVKIHSNNPSGYFFNNYDSEKYQFIQSGLRLSTWSMTSFEVTQELVDYTHETKNSKVTKNSPLGSSDESMYYAFTRDEVGDTDGINMRALTKNVSVTLKVKNLSSSSKVTGGVTGFVNKVNMATGIGFKVPDNKIMLQYFTFNGRTNWTDPDGNPTNAPSSGEDNSKYEGYIGETSATFLSFGRDLTLGENELYNLDIDFVYISGSLFDKENTIFEIDLDRDGIIDTRTKIPINITSQVINNDTSEDAQYALGIDIYISTLEIEHTSGDIDVEEWGDDVVIPL